jgi:hypothetical protein
VLFEANAYGGYNHVYWSREGGYDAWVAAGKPEGAEKQQYIYGPDAQTTIAVTTTRVHKVVCVGTCTHTPHVLYYHQTQQTHTQEHTQCSPPRAAPLS